MKCGNCGTENENNEMFCKNCGAELFSGDNTETIKKSVKKKPSRLRADNAPLHSLKKRDGSKAPSSDEQKTPAKLSPAERKANILLKIKLALGAVAVIALIIVIAVAVGRYGDTKGSRVASEVPLGRNIDFCIKETGEDFSTTSAYRDLKSIAKFNYVCESDKSVNISGITLPGWAVLVTEDSKRVLTSVECYDFSVLKDGWKGEHSSVRFTSDTVAYGMDEKTVTKTIGFDPYYTKKTSDNKALNCYRYYIVDNETGSERVFNYYVEFNDVNGTVVNAYDSEINYVGYILGIK